MLFREEVPEDELVEAVCEEEDLRIFGKGGDNASREEVVVALLVLFAVEEDDGGFKVLEVEESVLADWRGEDVVRRLWGMGKRRGVGVVRIVVVFIVIFLVVRWRVLVVWGRSG